MNNRKFEKIYLFKFEINPVGILCLNSSFMELYNVMWNLEFFAECEGMKNLRLWENSWE